eukprot:gnl/Trimastix_PCT/1369.p1 GENE.gnl/Trimastix_PCT/1369~~gnl/Trimastix_PCT/1369.p1  ORF type:complete len:203 (+),score=39.39 gnl/Trimastix_PCT/1369:36-611(+)
MPLKTLILAGPSGVGKSTIIRGLKERFPNTFALSISHTTRGPRGSEVNGREYHFISDQEFVSMIEAGDFIEHAQVHSSRYGTSRQAVEAVHAQGHVCILDIDMQGCKSVKAVPNFEALFTMVVPPSMEELERRLRGRGTETEEKILLRLENAHKEMEMRDAPDFWDAIIVNDGVERTIDEYARILTERQMV